ncbi:ATP-binding protein [Streptomyces sp. NPDC059740]|uniref:ATP-binding protein n=1 Tax=Streptomyces sp. NPDC059740 TaxID=3346926 RepID=UPI003666D8A8
MSLPVTRRIARAALLVAAGAAPVVGAAGAACAAEPVAAPNLGGLTAVDPGSLGDTVDGAARGATSLVGEVGAKTMKETVPAAGRTGGAAVKKVTPAAQKTAGQAAGTAGELVGDATHTTTKNGLSAATGLAPITKTLGGLPVNGLPLNGLPLV